MTDTAVIALTDDTFASPLCIEPQIGGIMEHLPAEWTWGTRECRTMTLTRFWIGDAVFNRGTAVLMTGEAHVTRQEAQLQDAVCEQRLVPVE